MRKVLVTVTVVSFTAIGLSAYGLFLSPAAIGTVYPAPATASLTCYQIDSGLQLKSVTQRSDVLAVFTNADHVCFLRPPMANPEWIQVVAAPVPQPTPAPATCPGYPTPPYQGMTCVNGGWIFEK